MNSDKNINKQRPSLLRLISEQKIEREKDLEESNSQKSTNSLYVSQSKMCRNDKGLMEWSFSYPLKNHQQASIKNTRRYSQNLYENFRFQKNFELLKNNEEKRKEPKKCSSLLPEKLQERLHNTNKYTKKTAAINIKRSPRPLSETTTKFQYLNDKEKQNLGKLPVDLVARRRFQDDPPLVRKDELSDSSEDFQNKPTFQWSLSDPLQNHPEMLGARKNIRRSRKSYEKLLFQKAASSMLKENKQNHNKDLEMYDKEFKKSNRFPRSLSQPQERHNELNKYPRKLYEQFCAEKNFTNYRGTQSRIASARMNPDPGDSSKKHQEIPKDIKTTTKKIKSILVKLVPKLTSPAAKNQMPAKTNIKSSTQNKSTTITKTKPQTTKTPVLTKIKNFFRKLLCLKHKGKKDFPVVEIMPFRTRVFACNCGGCAHEFYASSNDDRNVGYGVSSYGEKRCLDVPEVFYDLMDYVFVYEASLPKDTHFMEIEKMKLDLVKNPNRRTPDDFTLKRTYRK